jgi:hypothetical protein
MNGLIFGMLMEDKKESEKETVFFLPILKLPGKEVYLFWRF